MSIIQNILSLLVTGFPENPSLRILLFMLSLIAVTWTAVLLRLIHLRIITPRLTSGSESKLELEYPLISIVIPARNEERNIGGCLESVLAQRHPRYEVVVVDDSSTDGTLEIARGFEESSGRVKALPAGEPQQGWAGKPWACSQGAKTARGEWLLFLDADTKLSPDALSTAYEHARREGADVFTVAPSTECRSLWSKAALPVLGLIISLLFPVVSVNNPESRVAFVFGSFLLVRREAYLALGGHKRVRDAIVEDRAFGREAKGLGLKLRMVLGGRLLSARWAQEFGEVWSGLERVISSSVRGNARGGVAFAAAASFMWLLPFITLAYTLVLSIQGPLPVWMLDVLGLTAYTCALIFAAQAWQVFAYMHPDGVSIVSAPLGAVIFIGALLSTAYKTGRGKAIRWKGRDYRS